MSATTSRSRASTSSRCRRADLARAMEFYGETLGLRRSVYIEGRPFAEFETGNLTLTVMDPEKMGLPYATIRITSRFMLRMSAAARAELEAKGVEFQGEIFDTASATWGSSPTPTATS